MGIFLYAAGLIIGITIFLYILSTYESGKEKFKNYMEKKQPPPEPKLRPEEIDIVQRTPYITGKRVCPLCGTTLQMYEALYASQVKTETSNKILIYGCRYCYKPDED